MALPIGVVGRSLLKDFHGTDAMLTDAQIDRAKAATKYTYDSRHHEHGDCIRMAYAWLDAQTKTKVPNTRIHRALKHIIESWAGRYISTSDVEVAAQMHPDIRGTYPYYNISSRLVEPSARRLEGIGEAGKHPDYRDRYLGEEVYARQEP